MSKIISKSIFIYLLALYATVSFSQTSLIDIDFSKAGVVSSAKKKGSFYGPLPNGVIADFPGWNTSIASSEKLTENNRSFFRFNVDKFDFLVAFRLSSKKIKIPGYYTLKITCRTANNPLNVHIRQLKKPYKTFWEADTEVASGWKEYSFPVYLKNITTMITKKSLDSSNMVLYLSIKSGITDVASIKLLKSTQETYMTENLAKIQRPTKGTANFFRNSRFPLGKPTGWSIVRNNISGKIESDPANPGPNACPSLRLYTDKREPIRIYSEPFQSDDPYKKVQISFVYKAKHHWGVKISGTKISKSLTPAKTWKTVQMSYTPVPDSHGALLIFYGRGALNLDSLMAYSGDDVRDYASAGECEVALALPKSEINETTIQFFDEPAKINYYVTGKYKGGILKTKVVNIYGKEISLKDTKLSKAKGSFTYNVFPNSPLGTFRIEAWVEHGGKRISPLNEVIVNRIRRPVYWGKDAPNSPFGGHFFANPRILTIVKAAGFNWVRTNDSCMDATCWGWLEPKQGEWSFADSKITAYRKAKIKISGTIGTAPEWASFYNGKKHPYDYFNKLYQPKNIEAFKKYVRTVATRYKGIIDEYQFQNEPWSAVFWHKSYNPKTKKFDQGKTPVIDYVKLAKIAYAELKKVYPEARLYGFNTVYKKHGMKWTKEVFDAGGYKYCDMIDYHKYNYRGELCLFPEDSVEKAYNEAVGYIKENVNSPIKPVVMSEGNPAVSGAIPMTLKGTAGFSGLYKHTIPWKSKDNIIEFSDTSCRFIISHLALGIKRIFLYSDHCYHNIMRSPSFPVVIGADGNPYPSIAAFSNMAWLLEDRPFTKRLKVSKKVWAYIFAGKGKSVAVISGFRNGVYTIPKNDKIKVFDLLGNPVKNKAVYRGQILYVVSKLLPKDLGHILQPIK